jgi:hypothetical protein
MCVAFSPYYRQDDPRTSGAMNTYFRDALQAYAGVPYKDLHAYLERRFLVWYAKFKPAGSESVEVEDAAVGDRVSVGSVVGAAPPAFKRFSLEFDSGSAAPDAPPPAPAASSDEASGEETGTPSPLVSLVTTSGADPK